MGCGKNTKAGGSFLIKNRSVTGLGALALALNAVFLTTGCSSKEPIGIEKIEENKVVGKNNNITIGGHGGREFKIYLGDDNKIKYVCPSQDINSCGYEAGSREDFFWLNSDGSYFPGFTPRGKGVTCGTGSLYGYLALFMVKPFGVEDHSAKNPEICYSRFSKLDSTMIGPRVIFGLLTFGTPLISGGNMHTRVFDDVTFKQALSEANIESLKPHLRGQTGSQPLEGGLDFVYLSQDSITDDIEEKCNSILEDSSKKAGVVFMDKEKNRVLGASVFSEYKDEPVTQLISSQIQELIKNASGENEYILKNEDIAPYIPVEVAFPEIPAVPKLLKDEFETKAEFGKRVEAAVRERERQIRGIQRQYSLDVFERNSYIDNLQNSFKAYLEKEVEKKNGMVVSIKNNIPLLSKLLFLENVSGYNAKDFRYNAEEQKLYFNIYSGRNGFSQEVVSEMPAASAKEIKNSGKFRIIPDVEAKEGAIVLSGFRILDLASDKKFETKYTNMAYIPEVVSVSIVGEKEGFKAEASNQFQQYKQKDMPIVDTSSQEIWYVDVANTINAKVPKWFSEPSTDRKIIGYGEGTSLADAKSSARSDLSFMIKVKVNTVLTKTQGTNDFRSFSETKEQTKQSSVIELGPNSYKLFRQESADGRWYVALEYTES